MKDNKYSIILSEKEIQNIIDLISHNHQILEEEYSLLRKFQELEVVLENDSLRNWINKLIAEYLKEQLGILYQSKLNSHYWYDDYSDDLTEEQEKEVKNKINFLKEELDLQNICVQSSYYDGKEHNQDVGTLHYLEDTWLARKGLIKVTLM